MCQLREHLARIFFPPHCTCMNFFWHDGLVQEFFSYAYALAGYFFSKSPTPLLRSLMVGPLVYSSVVSQSLIMAESNAVNRFRVPKSGEEESKLLKESVPKSTVYKNKWSAKVFREWPVSRVVVQVRVIDSGGVFKDWTNLHKVDTFTEI